MRKVIIINGLIAGALVAGMWVITNLIYGDVMEIENGMLIGYASMVISLSMVFFGIKTIRDQYENGTISFWHAFRVGILITLIASVIYAITWEIHYNWKASDFGEKYATAVVEKLKNTGASASEIEAKKAEMARWAQWYKNPLIRFPMTLMEIFPVGLIITLISAAILRKPEILPANS